jgi:hypothetical protein
VSIATSIGILFYLKSIKEASFPYPYSHRRHCLHFSMRPSSSLRSSRSIIFALPPWLLLIPTWLGPHSLMRERFERWSMTIIFFLILSPNGAQQGMRMSQPQQPMRSWSLNSSSNTGSGYQYAISFVTTSTIRKSN